MVYDGTTIDDTGKPSDEILQHFMTPILTPVMGKSAWQRSIYVNDGQKRRETEHYKRVMASAKW